MGRGRIAAGSTGGINGAAGCLGASSKKDSHSTPAANALFSSCFARFLFRATRTVRATKMVVMTTTSVMAIALPQFSLNQPPTPGFPVLGAVGGGVADAAAGGDGGTATGAGAAGSGALVRNCSTRLGGRYDMEQFDSSTVYFLCQR